MPGFGSSFLIGFKRSNSKVVTTFDYLSNAEMVSRQSQLKTNILWPRLIERVKETYVAVKAGDKILGGVKRSLTKHLGGTRDIQEANMLVHRPRLIEYPAEKLRHRIRRMPNQSRKIIESHRFLLVDKRLERGSYPTASLDLAVPRP